MALSIRLIQLLPLMVVTGFSSHLRADTQQVKIRGFFSTGVTGTTRSDKDVANSIGVEQDPANLAKNSKYHKAPQIEKNTLFGLNFNAAAGDDITLAAQMLVDGAASDYSLVSLDWAFLTYQPNDHMALRMGRQKTPVWMISDIVDVRKDQLWSNPPVEVYALFPVKVHDGLGATFSTKISGVGLALEPFFGTASLKREYPQESGPSSPRIFGSSLTADFDWVKARVAYTKSHWNVGPGAALWNERKLDFISAGFQGENSRVVFAGEYTTMKDLSKSEFEKLTNDTSGRIDQLNQLSKVPQASRAAATGSNLSDAEIAAALGGLGKLEELYGVKFDGMTGYYGALGYRVTDRFLPVFTYASATCDETQKYYFMTHKTMQIDLGYDASAQTNVKIQGRQVSVSKNRRSEFSINEDRDAKVNTYALTLNTTF
ncbi:MAG: hypothetical protein NTV34_15230 [Proteobacteria bacterium]|nr:hypothetical protein [Pseudomonadota bacterium]